MRKENLYFLRSLSFGRVTRKKAGPKRKIKRSENDNAEILLAGDTIYQRYRLVRLSIRMVCGVVGRGSATCSGREGWILTNDSISL